MNLIDINKLNTFGEGKWIAFPSKKNEPQKFENNCNAIYKYCQNTALCLNQLDKVKNYLSKGDMYLFVDNSDKLQIVCDIKHNGVNNMYGVADRFELNILEEYSKQANAFLAENSTLERANCWQKQINWISRLRLYCNLYDSKKYDNIDMEQLVKDIAYNGYSLHYKNYQKIYSSGTIYYPIIKRELFLKPMLKPMIANFLRCSTREVYVGKYNGNGRGIKYIVGDLVSPYIAADNTIERIYGSINFNSFHNEATKIPADSIHIIGGNLDINLVNA